MIMAEWKYAEFMKELGKMQNKSGEFRPLGCAETNTLGKTQKVSGKTETLNHPILNVLHKIRFPFP